MKKTATTATVIDVPAELADRPLPKPVAPATFAQAQAVTAAELTELDPPRIDALIIAAETEIGRLEGKIAAAWESLYRTVCVRKVPARTGRGNKQAWPITKVELKARAAALVDGADIDPDVIRYQPLLNAPGRAEQYRADIAASLDLIAALRAEKNGVTDGAYRTLTDEYTRRDGWSRFILVPGGHIHRSTGCSTLRPTTLTVLRPELSGLNEKDAVRVFGRILCSHCFPTAPTEWTTGNPQPEDDTTCSGSGAYADPKSYNPRHLSRYAPCANDKCKARPSVTSLGYLRKHKFDAK